MNQNFSPKKDNNPQKPSKIKRFWNKLFKSNQETSINHNQAANLNPIPTTTNLVEANKSISKPNNNSIDFTNRAKGIDHPLSQINSDVSFQNVNNVIETNLSTLKITGTEIIDAYETVDLNSHLTQDLLTQDLNGALNDATMTTNLTNENKIPNVNTDGIVNHCYTISENPPSELMKSLFNIGDKYHNSSDDELFEIESNLENSKYLYRPQAKPITTITKSKPIANTTANQLDQTEISDTKSDASNSIFDDNLNQYQKLTPNPEDTQLFDESFFEGDEFSHSTQPDYSISVTTPTQSIPETDTSLLANQESINMHTTSESIDSLDDEMESQASIELMSENEGIESSSNSFWTELDQLTSNTLEPLTTNLDEVINPTQPITNQTLDVQVHDLDSITPTTNSNVSESNYDVQTSISESQNAVVVEPTASELVGQKIVSNLTNQNNSTDSTVLSTNSVDSHIKPMTIPVDLEEKMKFFYSQLLYPRELQEVDLSLKKWSGTLIKSVPSESGAKE